jgi:outer membrane biosynthesis protein TonB
MPTTPTPTDAELQQIQPVPDESRFPRNDGADPESPVSAAPEVPASAQNKPVVLRSSRYGELQEHELLHLLDSIEDERARSRFRESIYISLFVWMAIAWVVLYGPRYLWHAPKIVLPSDVLRDRELTVLNAPRIPHMAAPPPPKVDTHTLEKLREDTARRMPPPPSPTEQPKIEQPAAPAASAIAPPPTAAPNIPLPSAPRPAPAPIADAPTPQPSSRPNFNTGSTSASDSIQNAIRNSARGGGGDTGRSAGSPGGSLNTGVDILSDTQGVDFDPYIRRILHDIYYTWLPLIPEEARPPLNKSGETLVRFRILPDGHIGGMWLDGSTHDDALNRAAWGSITGVGQFPPLPSQFHGPNLELRIHYLVNKHEE